jgi:DNA-binding transcriptional LysR family regulator
MDLAWLEDFLKLAELGNFSRAAEARNSSQPAFSRRIRMLEDWVGTTLIDRDTHRIALTEAGLAFRPVVEEVTRRLALGRNQAREIGEAQTSGLRFAATHALSVTFFPPWLRALEAERHLGPVTLIANHMVACERYMLEGLADFLLCHEHPAASTRLEPGGFLSIPVGEDMLLPVSAPDGDGAPLFSLAADSDAPIPFLEFEERSGMGRILQSAQAAARVATRLKPVFRSHLANALLSMARDGRGITWTPMSLAEADLRSGQLVRAGDESWDVPIQICLVRPRARRNEAVEAFWKSLAAGAASR